MHHARWGDSSGNYESPRERHRRELEKLRDEAGEIAERLAMKLHDSPDLYYKKESFEHDGAKFTVIVKIEK